MGNLDKKLLLYLNLDKKVTSLADWEFKIEIKKEFIFFLGQKENKEKYHIIFCSAESIGWYL